MSERRTAITGLGVVSPAGIGAQALWEALVNGEKFIRPISLFDAGEFPCSIAGQIEGFSARKFVPKNYRKSVKVMARDIELAVAASDLAVRDAEITSCAIDADNPDIDSWRFGCNIGAGLICTDLDELGSAINTAVVDGKFNMKTWGEKGINNLTPLWLLKYLPNMLACHVTIIHCAKGPSNTITCGDASGHLAAGEASRLLAAGRADAVICGSAESKLNSMGLLRQKLLGRLCTTANDRPETAPRPFDAAHCGTVIGEGGGLLILEDLQRAQKRDKKPYAEIVGFGAACDPDGIDITRPTAGSLDLAVERAMADAGIGPQDVDLVVTHGTAVPDEDRREVEAWSAALGQRAQEVHATSITGTIGSLFAGAGGVELAVAAMAVKNQTVPPTANLDECDRDCKLNFSDTARKADIEYAVTGSFSVGGQSGACVLRRIES